MRPIRITAVLALLVTLLLPALSPPAGWTKTLEPMVVGWEQIFKLEWQVSERRGRPVLSGYVANHSPYQVTHIQLLVDALDASGAIVGQEVSWAGGGGMGPFSRAYFEVPAPREAAATYRMSVFAFDRVESDSERR